ncbi:MAG: hypothetical protein KKC75_05215 [Nanoarchaeota archaeon]|nr:hypothetical protein [Nanoarchaeota archaeon]MBU1004974.1 hypothetical protein [Nanoarchaeota archaeon]MBU1946791.1 hypothetical protein [Nanoarchaeota archaeon]
MRTEESIHNKLILDLVNKKEAEGYKVWADHISHPNGMPSEYEGYVPDMIFYKDGNYECCEAETTQTLDTEHTKNQWRTFSSRKGVDFSVIVPKESYEDARRLAILWGINVKTVWYMGV